MKIKDEKRLSEPEWFLHTLINDLVNTQCTASIILHEYLHDWHTPSKLRGINHKPDYIEVYLYRRIAEILIKHLLRVKRKGGLRGYLRGFKKFYYVVDSKDKVVIINTRNKDILREVEREAGKLGYIVEQPNT